MATSTSRIFGFYALILSALGVWIWQLRIEKQQQYEAYNAWNRSLKMVQNDVSRSTENTAREFHRSYYDYPSPIMLALRNKADFVLKNRFGNDLANNELQKSPHPPSPGADNWFPYLRNIMDEPDAVQQFFKMQRVLADSLFSFLEADSTVVEPFFSKNRTAAAEKILAGHRDDQQYLLLNLTNLNQISAGHRTLESLEKRIAGHETISSEALMPVLIKRPGCLRVGEIFHGEVFAAVYSTRLREGVVEILVNSQKLPTEAGLGKFRRVFQTPGRKFLDAEIRIKNLVTKHTEVIKKQFEVEICE